MIILFNIPPSIVPHLVTISAADWLILSIPFSRYKYGLSNADSFVRFFFWNLPLRNNYGLGSAGLGSTGLVSAVLGYVGLGWARQELAGLG